MNRSSAKNLELARAKAKKEKALAKLRLARQKENEKQAELRLERVRLKAEKFAEQNRQIAAFKAEVCEYFTSNQVTLDVTGKKFGRTRERIRQILKENGIDQRNWGRPDRGKHLDEIKDSAAADFHSGMKQGAVCEKYGLTQTEWDQIPTDALTSKIARLLAGIEKGDHWIYKSSIKTDHSRRPSVNFGKGKMPLSHFVWKEINGNEPQQWLMNTCGIKHCVKPDHWADLPPKEVAKQRRPHRKRLPSKIVEEIRASKLSRKELMVKYDRDYPTIVRIKTGGYTGRITNEQIRNVLELKGKMNLTKISQHLGIGYTNVWRIATGRMVEDPNR